ncbi:MAG: hypothetical protein AB7S26_10470 [Sandaracinaceae bacterium]
MPTVTRAILGSLLAVLSTACTGELSTLRPGADGARPGEDGGRDVHLLDGSSRPPEGYDGGTSPPDAGDVPPPPPEGRRPAIDVDAMRPVAILGRAELMRLAERAPTIGDAWLLGVLEDPSTMFYDHATIVPGYQDSFGDNVVTPIGMRPNTIDPNLINLAVPGGHEQIFVQFGVFHFPFGRPAGSTERDLAVVDFWRLPRGDDGTILPVVYWQRDPNGYTHRVEWMFPRGTVLGEMLFLVDASGQRWPFEIRTRVRELDGWHVDVFRPFPTAESFAQALERTRAERAEWASSSEITALIAHARDPSTLRSARLAATHFSGAFDPIDGAEDPLPGLSDDSILRELLMRQAFRSARGAVWKSQGSLSTYAPTTDAAFQIVPRAYSGGFLSVDEATCSRCHRDAGRPFRDWYPNILAYGELWGEDESFSWHPFATQRFVDGSGRVVQFNNDNRQMRQDFVSAGVLVPYEPSRHPGTEYRKIPGPWKDYAY